MMWGCPARPHRLPTEHRHVTLRATPGTFGAMGSGGTTPVWRQGFDAVERQIAPRLESAVKTEQFAVAVGLATRMQRLLQDHSSRATRRLLHQLNLPAGTDVTRILNEIGRLQRQVAELTTQLDHTRAQLAAERAGTADDAADTAGTAGTGTRSAGRRATDGRSAARSRASRTRDVS